MYQRVGTCSICGGDVYGFRGMWLAVIPPPPDKCSRCGAVAKGDIIEMFPAPDYSNWMIYKAEQQQTVAWTGKE